VQSASPPHTLSPAFRARVAPGRGRHRHGAGDYAWDADRAAGGESGTEPRTAAGAAGATPCRPCRRRTAPPPPREATGSEQIANPFFQKVVDLSRTLSLRLFRQKFSERRD
jgi:hypothetical protein